MQDKYCEKLRAVCEKYNIKTSRVMSPSDHIWTYHLFRPRYVSMDANLSKHRDLLAAQVHLKGNAVFFAQGNIMKKYELFLEI